MRCPGKETKWACAPHEGDLTLDSNISLVKPIAVHKSRVFMHFSIRLTGIRSKFRKVSFRGNVCYTALARTRLGE